ncbi:MAG: hypothetical protein ACKON9_26970, partial [Planctomycetaceae bacterium]
GGFKLINGPGRLQRTMVRFVCIDASCGDSGRRVQFTTRFEIFCVVAVRWCCRSGMFGSGMFLRMRR